MGGGSKETTKFGPLCTCGLELKRQEQLLAAASPVGWARTVCVLNSHVKAALQERLHILLEAGAGGMVQRCAAIFIRCILEVPEYRFRQLSQQRLQHRATLVGGHMNACQTNLRHEQAKWAHVEMARDGQALAHIVGKPGISAVGKQILDDVIVPKGGGQLQREQSPLQGERRS